MNGFTLVNLYYPITSNWYSTKSILRKVVLADWTFLIFFYYFADEKFLGWKTNFTDKSNSWVPFTISYSGGTLKTAALRPMGIYGERETAFLTEMMKRGSMGRGTIVRLSYWRKQHDNDHQIIYAGNAAWAHLCTMKSLCESPEQCVEKLIL